MISIGEKDQTLETDSKETTEDIVITDSQKIKRRIITESLTFCLKDNVGAWIMDKDGNYSLVKIKEKSSHHKQL